MDINLLRANFRAEVIKQGYSKAHADMLAKQLFPTPRQAAARNARQARSNRANERKAAEAAKNVTFISA